VSDNGKEALTLIADNLARALNDVDQGYVQIHEDDARLMWAALGAYLAGRTEGLDEAFGVKRGRGAPKTGPTAEVLRRVKLAMFRGDKSWLEIADETGVDVRTLQREVRRHESFVFQQMAEELISRKAP